MDETLLPGDPQPESRHITPTTRCPMPSLWTSRDADSTEVEVSEMIGGLVRGLQPRMCIETGSGFGQTTVAIAGALRTNYTMAIGAAQKGFLYSFESDAERADWAQREIEQSSLANYAHVEHCKSTDVSFAAKGVIDFAFFDSFYETRVEEFLHFHEWMRPGTVVAFHDSAPGHGRARLAECGITWASLYAAEPDLIYPGDREGSPDLIELIQWQLERPGYVRLINMPTPRGIAVGEVLR